jgi:hypothetical protein
LAVIDEENDTIHAMSYGLTAVLGKLKDIYEQLNEGNALVKPLKSR